MNLASDTTHPAWDNCRMFHDTKLPLIHRVATRRVEIAQALNLEDESEVAAAIEDISHTREAQQQLGHKSVKTTEIYLRARAGEKVTPTK